MPYHYERDDARRRVTFTFYGEFKEAEGLAVLDQSALEGTGHYGFLYDLRRQHGSPTMRELRRVAQAESSTVPVQGARGPVAIVVKNDSSMYRMVCVYTELARPNIMIQIF